MGVEGSVAGGWWGSCGGGEAEGGGEMIGAGSGDDRGGGSWLLLLRFASAAACDGEGCTGTGGGLALGTGEAAAAAEGVPATTAGPADARRVVGATVGCAGKCSEPRVCIAGERGAEGDADAVDDVTTGPDPPPPLMLVIWLLCCGVLAAPPPPPTLLLLLALSMGDRIDVLACDEELLAPPADDEDSTLIELESASAHSIQ